MLQRYEAPMSVGATRSTDMKFRDLDPGVIAQLYDLLQADHPHRVEKQRTQVRMECGNVPERALRRRVIERLLGDKQVYRLMRERLMVKVREPMRSSPLEEIKALTAILNPMGERTGGNFGAAF